MGLRHFSTHFQNLKNHSTSQTKKAYFQLFLRCMGTFFLDFKMHQNILLDRLTSLFKGLPSLNSLAKNILSLFCVGSKRSKFQIYFTNANFMRRLFTFFHTSYIAIKLFWSESIKFALMLFYLKIEGTGVYKIFYLRVWRCRQKLQ